ncbi:MAG: hypothetical protein U5L07_07680 [Desulfobacterales bacterium]|nr:hypothetical protein [Desulfobacterales bacterium]
MKKSRFQKNCLIIGLVCFLIAGIAGFKLCQAETTAEVYGLFMGGDLGFDPGPASRAEIECRPIKWASVRGYGQYAWIHKTPHDSGHHEWYGAGIRIYPWRDIFVGGSLGYSGYKSKGDRSTWEKGDWGPAVSAGWNGETWAAYASYYWPDDTENNTYGYSATFKYRFYKNWLAYMRSTIARFDQRVPGPNGGREIRMERSALTLGAGWRF